MVLVKTESSTDKITEELKNEDLAPPDLGKIYTQLSGWYSYYAQMIKRIQLVKPGEWLKIKASGNPKEYSDARTDMEWEATKMGRDEVALKWELKRIEAMMGGVKTRLYADQVSARNQY
jgi:hypothetical protein